MKILAYYIKLDFGKLLKGESNEKSSEIGWMFDSSSADIEKGE